MRNVFLLCWMVLGGLLVNDAVLAAMPDCGDYADIELAVLKNPSNPGQILDLAYCQLQLGDAASSISLLDQLQKDFFPPEHVLRIIHLLRGQAVAQLAMQQNSGESQTHITLDMLVGRESNLNLGPATSVATLTLPSGNVELPLEANMRPRSGNVSLLQGRLVHITPLDKGESQFRQWEWVADMRYRYPLQNISANHWQVNLGAAYHTRDLSGWDNLLYAGYQQATLDGQHVLSLQQFQWGKEVPVQSLLGVESDTCRLTGSLWYEQRSYPVQTILDGKARGIGGGGFCVLANDQRVGLMLRLGVDTPLGDRPGGEQQKQELQTYWDAVSLLGGKAHFAWQWSLQHDRAGYSELLNDNAKRVLRRSLFRLEWERPLQQGWSWLVVLEKQQQQANHPLFAWNLATMYSGFRYIWH